MDALQSSGHVSRLTTRNSSKLFPVQICHRQVMLNRRAKPYQIELHAMPIGWRYMSSLVKFTVKMGKLPV